MNISLSSWFKKHGGSNRSYAVGSDPCRDWLILLACFAGLALIVFVTSAFIFLKVNSGEFFFSPSGNGGDVETINRIRLEKISGALEKRSLHYQETLRYTSVIDPSL